MIEPGEQAPDFALPDHRGSMQRLRDQAGRWVLLWWYPKALTPGCTSCGSQFQRLLSEFHDKNCEILGASYDSPERNREFALRNKWSFPLLTADLDTAASFGAKRPDDDEWYDVPRRISYLIDPDGVVRRAYRVLDPTAHAAEVLSDLKALTED